MKETEALILTGDGFGLIIDPSAEAMKAQLLKDSSLFVTITDPASAEAARLQLGKLGAMRIALEKCRKKVKQPALDFGRDTDAKAAAFIADVLVAEATLNKLMGEYAFLVNQERARLAREREEAERQQREAEVALRKAEAEAEAARAKAAEEVEAARLQAEEALWNSTTPEEDEAAAEKARQAEEAARVAAQQEAERVAALQQAAAKEAVRMEAATHQVAFVPEKVAGVKMVPDFEVTDIHALYRHNVGLVNLSERRMEILDAIARGTIGEALPSIPGLRVFLKAKVNSR